MNKLFNNILVPVEFSKQSSQVISQAVMIANHFRCDLHLVYVEHNSMADAEKHLVQALTEGELADYEVEMMELKAAFQPQLEDGLQLITAMRRGSREQHVTSYALQHAIDLIIVEKPRSILPMRFSRSFNINRISKKTGCPVLTVKGTARLEAIKNIVLPVDAHLPLRKVMFASYLARHFNARIHLIALSEPGEEDNVENKVYLYKTYQLLRENTNLTVECHTVHGGNIADTTLEYARQINADLIVVNPGKEMLLSGFVNRLFARLLFNESRIPVMTVAPAR
ncbi:universal stress protein [Pseudobacter ginsenosidimutans]|jgi:K+-sensing histidine kinase KdpD|uniref:Nucleotide-binding universal stress UspA family protein n=1 Tax=Pseudobacter ginsenosidimutans TaxID=661488 RepID=A0A4Q7MU12_9BACT|nr:universal stress protein [Pseudobacter ginsenosidimutans]QEC41763.1 universal stress protein [Pseudobacter ginsenosidimutans]RZS71429.1 nucleotide-binding universal stress UspA family protein [Pseudobacter ginsenosidimutans]